MPSRTGAIHVATTSRAYKGKVYQSHLLRRTYRQDGKVLHETLGNISHLPPHIIEIIRAGLRGESYVPANDAFKILRSLPHGHVAAVLGTLRNLELEDVIASRRSRERDLVVSMITARIIEPGSKLATARGLHEETQFTGLANALDLGSATEDDLYGAMDWLVDRQERIEAKLAKRHLSEGSLVLYDLTSVRYTGRHCTLARLGRQDREGRKRFPQIAFGLLCNAEGCPVAVEVFEGGTVDHKTLPSQIKKMRERFGVSRLVVVGDRGIVTDARIRDDLAPEEGLAWIGALKAPAIRKLMADGPLQMSLFDERDMAEIKSPDFPGERLIACRNPLLAAERARVREELLQATERQLEKIAEATRRAKRRLRGKDKIGLRVGKVINSRNVAKHFTLKITSRRFSYARNEAKIREEAALDGIYVIRTSVPAEEMAPADAVGAYKSLSRVERAFRCMKTMDLKVRPIHHRLEDRVKAHVFLCMLAYYVEWHMRRALAPMIFQDEDRDQAERLRDSIVAPAKRSPTAERKAQTKRTCDGTPVHSFQTLLKELATIALNQVKTLVSPAEFQMLTTPTPLQRRALDLLGVRLSA